MTRSAMIALLLAVIASPAAAQPIGAVVELEPAAYGTPPARAPAELAAGEDVVADELIQTLAGAATRIRFLDDSDLRLGASSMLVLDRLVYDPDRGARELVLGLAVGAARFVSGDVDREGFALHTPVALIGIRGTDFVVVVEDSGRTAVSVLEGAVVVTPRGGAAVIADAGETVVVEPAREPRAIVRPGLFIPPDPGLGPLPRRAEAPEARIDLAHEHVVPSPPRPTVPRTHRSPPTYTPPKFLDSFR